MPRVLRTSQAEEDLLEIWAHVAADTPAAGDRLLDRIASACEMLAKNPAAGRTRGELAERLRSFPVGKYVVFYRPIDDEIVVIRVLHGARDLPDLL